MRFSNVLFGADPELFIQDKEGKFISAIGKIGGTKHDPRPIDLYGSYVQEDNVAVEFNIAPAKGKIEFIRNIYRPLSYIKDFVKKQIGANICISASAIFTEDQLLDPRAQAFGCDIDYNAWTGKANPRPKAAGEHKNLRTAGGHLHISWERPNMAQRIALVKMLDLTQGVPSVIMDEDDTRRNLYGKAGAYRPKSYGVEYRVLSNFWIKSPRLMAWLIDQAHLAMTFLSRGMLPQSDKDAILASINGGNKREARKLIDKYGLKLVKL